LALDGVVYYQEKVIIRKGEVVKSLIDVPHCLGASAHTAFVQVAITGWKKGETVWLNGVKGKAYNR
jgi:hypothetical protein